MHTPNPKRHHHFLPQLYLKGFSEPGSRWFVWEYERGSSFNPGPVEYRHNPWRAPVRSAGAQQDLYARRKLDGTVDYDMYENILETLERPATPIFQKIRSKKLITVAEKVLFASYIGVMRKRVPAREQRMAPIWTDIVNRTDWAGLVASAKRSGYAPANDEVHRLKQEYMQVTPREIALKTMLMPQQRVLDALAAMNWRFFVAPAGAAFATSDNPVLFPEGIGIIDPKAVLAFPIGRDVTLVVSWHGLRDLAYVNATKRRVQQMNAQVLRNSTTLGYYSFADKSIQQFLDGAAA